MEENISDLDNQGDHPDKPLDNINDHADHLDNSLDTLNYQVITNRQTCHESMYLFFQNLEFFYDI